MSWFPQATRIPFTSSGAWLPAGPWPTGTPDSQGMDAVKLALVDGIQHGVVIRHGVEIWAYDNPDAVLDWASCNRTWQDKLWGRWLMNVGLEHLETEAISLPCHAAMDVPNEGARVKHACSYTSTEPVGQVWRYSSGDWWPWQARAVSELLGWANAAEAWTCELMPCLAGTTFSAGLADDGTLRVKASCRDNARLMGLMLNQGVDAFGVTLIDPAYIARGIAGGPDGDGLPFKWEAYQTHLIRESKCNAGSSQNSPQWVDLPGVPDGFMALDGNDEPDHGWGAIVAIPSLGLIVAARGATPAWWLPDIVGACV